MHRLEFPNGIRVDTRSWWRQEDRALLAPQSFPRTQITVTEFGAVRESDRHVHGDDSAGFSCFQNGLEVGTELDPDGFVARPGLTESHDPPFSAPVYASKHDLKS
jgi:hypothetical protein